MIFQRWSSSLISELTQQDYDREHDKSKKQYKENEKCSALCHNIHLDVEKMTKWDIGTTRNDSTTDRQLYKTQHEREKKQDSPVLTSHALMRPLLCPVTRTTSSVTMRWYLTDVDGCCFTAGLVMWQNAIEWTKEPALIVSTSSLSTPYPRRTELIKPKKCSASDVCRVHVYTVHHILHRDRKKRPP